MNSNTLKEIIKLQANKKKKRTEKNSKNNQKTSDKMVMSVPISNQFKCHWTKCHNQKT